MQEEERPKDDIISNDYELDKHIDDVMKKREKKQFEATFDRKNKEI